MGKGIINQLIFESFKFMIAFSAYLFSPSLSSINQIAGTAWIAIPAYIVFIFIAFFRKICRPITIRVIMNNFVTKEKCTKFFAHSTKSEPERTVSVKVYIERHNSIFYRLGIWYIKNRACSVVFNTVPENYFTLMPESNHLIQKLKYGFEIDLSDMIKQSLERNGSIIERDISFTIVENRDADINNNCKVDIMPKYKVNGNNVGFIIEFLYDMKIEDKHSIEFYKNYVGLQLPI